MQGNKYIKIYFLTIKNYILRGILLERKLTIFVIGEFSVFKYYHKEHPNEAHENI